MRIHGQDIAVRARVETLHGLSAHADWKELIVWLSQFDRPPKQTFAVHGEASASADFVDAVREHLGWDASVAVDGATVEA